MDWPIKITGDFTPLVQSASKIVDRIGDAVFCGRERKEVWKKALQEAQTEQDRQKILSGKWQFFGEKLVPCLDIVDSSANAFLAIGQEQEVRNLAGNMRMALEAAQNVSDEEVAEGCIDPDWFARWRREARVIGNEEMQRLWGRILVEEAKKPESVSYRTLDVLKNLTKHEAELFSRMGQWILGIDAIPCGINYNFSEFKSQDYSDLQDCGLIRDLSFVNPKYIFLNKKYFIQGNGFLINIDELFIDKDKSIFSFINCVRLSNVGIDILKIADIDKLNKDKIIYLCKNIDRDIFNSLGKRRITAYLQDSISKERKLIYGKEPPSPGTISGMP